MLVSVVLPVYNSEDTLEQTLISILDQKFYSFEIIAVDDGSTDATQGILVKYAKQSPRLKNIRLPKNLGIVKALNVGLKASNGTWIARMDADDVMMPNRLQSQLDYLQRNPDLDLIGAQFKLFSHQSKLRPGQIKYQDWSNSLTTDKQIKKNLFIECPISHPTFFAKKDFFLEMGGYRENVWPEDYDLLFRIWLKGNRMGKVPEILIKKGDIPSRLAYNDNRCSRQSMFQAKAHFFKQKGLSKNKGKLVICGTGSSASKIAKALEAEKQQVDFFTDNKNSPTQRYFMDKPVLSLNNREGLNLLKGSKDCFFILAIGEEKGRIDVEKIFQNSAYQYMEDYVRFI